MDVEEDSTNKCAVCYERNNPETIVKCNQCSLTVHLKCYGCSTKSFHIWKCRYCIYTEEQNIDAQHDNYSILCRICNQKTYGALKPCANNDGFAHLICALWTPFTFVRNQYHYSPIHNIQKCQQYKHVLEKLHCAICFKNHATIKCRIKGCSQYFHPLCLMGKKDDKQNKCMRKQDFMIEKMRAAMYYVYCPNHAHLHQDYDPLKIRRIDRQAIIKTLPTTNDDTPSAAEVPTKAVMTMSVDDTKTNNYNEIPLRHDTIETPFSYNDTMFNDNDSVFNQNPNYFQHLHSPFGRELSPAFAHHMNANYNMFSTDTPKPMCDADIDSNMDDIGTGTTQPPFFDSNTTTPSGTSPSALSRSRVPSITFNQLQQQQLQYNQQQMNNNDPNTTNFASFHYQ